MSNVLHQVSKWLSEAYDRVSDQHKQLRRQHDRFTEKLAALGIDESELLEDEEDMPEDIDEMEKKLDEIAKDDPKLQQIAQVAKLLSEVSDLLLTMFTKISDKAAAVLEVQKAKGEIGGIEETEIEEMEKAIVHVDEYIEFAAQLIDQISCEESGQCAEDTSD